jgi:FKBP-type peptidyl-prolyl cis-trans isomerase FklB
LDYKKNYALPLAETIKLVSMIRKFICFSLTLFILLPAVAQKKKRKDKSSPPPPAFALRNQVDTISYAIGVSIAQNLKTQGLDTVSIEVFSRAMAAFYKKDSLLISVEKANPLLSAHFQGLYEKKTQLAKAAGLKFLEENKQKPGVVVLPSGLQYQILTAGTGAKPAATDKIKVHYVGTLTDGTEFDSSRKRGQPATLNVNQVIPGWIEALQLMPVGSRWKLVIPSELAYADRGAGANIPPNSVLVFDVELLGIEK